MIKGLDYGKCMLSHGMTTWLVCSPQRCAILGDCFQSIPRGRRSQKFVHKTSGDKKIVL